MKQYYVYILTNNTHTTLYIGVTNDLRRRLYEHQNKFVDSFSNRYNTIHLVYYETTQDVESAIMREKVLKKWSRVKKDKLISSFNPNWDDLTDIVNM